MIELFIASTIVAMFLVIWFRTEAYLEYCRLFRFDRISHFKDYEEKRLNDVSLTYHKYLRQYHDGFFIRLITCPVCTAAWISIFISFITWQALVLPVTFIVGLILFGIIDRLLG